MEQFAKPGSRTVYSTAPRYGLPNPSDTPVEVSPASYDNNKNGIKWLEETIPPFDTTEIRGRVKYDGFPGPSSYNPLKRPRIEIGTPLFNDRGVKCPDTRYNTAGPGPAYKLPDPWIQSLIEIYHNCFTMAPRVEFEKFVSNNAPTVCHPQDVRCFLQGGDGRMYPWRRPKRVSKIPGPIYNVFGTYTSNSPGPFVMNFSTASERPDIFPPVKGFSPADFDTSGDLNGTGGYFLGKTDYPRKSIPRYFEALMRRAYRTKSPGPLEYWLPGSFDKESSKAVSAPFKSGVPKLGFEKKRFGPGPADHFDSHMTEADLEFPLFPFHCWDAQPPEKAPFNTSAERFSDYTVYEPRPEPPTYCIPGFADWLRYLNVRHRPAFVNPKLGFLTSANARPSEVFRQGLPMDAVTLDPPTVPGKWRNIRPKKMQTFPYHGVPPKAADSPGPIYDTNPPCKAVKARKDWFDPRDYTGTGFENSGCGRNINFATCKGNPGPMYLIPSSIPGPGGRVNMTEPRFVTKKPFGPGPRHKLHEKMGSMWRATQLGSYNTYLKGIGELRPSAGGFQPQGPIDHLADLHQGYRRVDDYADEINPKTKLDD